MKTLLPRNSKLTGMLILLLGFIGWRWLSGSSRGQKDSSGSSTGLKVNDVLVDVLMTRNGYGQMQTSVWYLVAKMETANFTSNLFVNYNNFLGMKQPQKRSTTSKGPSPTGWASYASWEKCAEDLVLYLKEFNYPNNFSSMEDQLVFMKEKGYYEESFQKYYDLVTAWAYK